MKKLLVLASILLWVACSKSSDIKLAETQQTNSLSARQANNTHFSVTQSNVGGDVYQGGFTATGFVSGAGATNEVVYVTIPLGSNGAGLSNATYTFNSIQTFNFGSGNTITFKCVGSWSFTGTGPGIAIGSGTWSVRTGTGSYAKLKGTGTLNITSIDLVNGATVDEYDGYFFYAN